MIARGARPRLSVLMPARNAEKHIRVAVFSTLRSLPPDSELLVLNDASTDGTARLLDAFKDRRLRVITSRSSRGVAEAMNALVREARGELIARMDADDVCLPWRFRFGLRRAEQGAVVLGSALVFSGVLRPHRPRLVPRTWEGCASVRRLLQENFLSNPTLLVRKDAIAESGPFIECGAEDYDMWLRLAADGRQFHLVPTPVLLYRKHATQITRTNEPTSNLDDPRLMASWLRAAESCDIPLSPGVAQAANVHELRKLLPQTAP